MHDAGRVKVFLDGYSAQYIHPMKMAETLIYRYAVRWGSSAVEAMRQCTTDGFGYIPAKCERLAGYLSTVISRVL